MHRPRTTRHRLEARRTAERASNAVALAATAHMDRVPATADDYWHDLRRGRRWIYGGLLRFVDRCADVGTPLDVVLAGLDALRWYTLDVYGQPARSGAPARV